MHMLYLISLTRQGTVTCSSLIRMFRPQPLSVPSLCPDALMGDVDNPRPQARFTKALRGCRSVSSVDIEKRAFTPKSLWFGGIMTRRAKRSVHRVFRPYFKTRRELCQDRCLRGGAIIWVKYTYKLPRKSDMERSRVRYVASRSSLRTTWIAP